MTEPQREAWRTFVAELPWLNQAHRAILELACKLQTRIEADPAPGVTLLQTYASVLSKLGATPVDDTKVSVPDDDGEDGEDRFFA